MRHTFAAVVCGGLLLAPAASSAQAEWFDLPVSGYLGQVVGTDAPSLAPRFLRDLIGVFQDPAMALANRAGAERIRDCLGDLQRLRARWLEARRVGGEVGLRAAAGEGREALEAFLDLFDLRLRRAGSAWRVVPTGGEARRRAAADGAAASLGSRPGDGRGAVCGTGPGWGSAEVERRLNAGEAIAWDLPESTVSLPLSPRVWLDVVYGEEVGTEAAAEARIAARGADLVGRLVTDPRAAQLYVALSGLDDPTLAWLRRSPRTLSLLSGGRLETFARLGRGLRVRDGRVRVPGGDGAAAFWEDLVDAPVTDPERFVDRLFERSLARVAHAYDLASRLSGRHRRFVLGDWQPDAGDRRRGREALWRVVEGLPLPDSGFAGAASGGLGELRCRAGGGAGGRAGARAAAVSGLDPAAVLRALSVDGSGRLVGPAPRDFWERVFDDDRVPEDPVRELGRIDSLPPADAAFVLASTCDVPPEVGRTRLRAFAFVQRRFVDGAAADLPAALSAARAVMRYPMLMLSVERMAIDDPRVYVALARAARRFDGIAQPLRLREALSQFQGAVALVERARLARAMTPDAAGAALLALAAVPMTGDGGFEGGVAGWLAGRLLPALGVPAAPSFESGSTDLRLLAALAGAPEGESPVVDWEGLTYRFDPHLAQFERYRRTRDRLGGNRVDAVLALWALATELTAGVGAAGDLPPLVDRLEASVARIRDPKVGLHVPDTRSLPYAEFVRPLVDDLREMAGRGRLRGLPGVAARLRAVVDVLAADLLRTLPYVLHLANATEAASLGDDVAARHEFGVRIDDRAARARAPWTLPRARTAPPPPFHRIGEFWVSSGEDRFTYAWHVYGGLLSLDLALAPLYLSLLSGVIPPAEPAFTADEEEHFAHGVALFNAAGATGEDVAAVAAAIRRGRARVRGLGRDAAGLPDLGREIGLSPERGDDLAWTLRGDPDALERSFSRSELLWLGLTDGRPPAGWGAPAVWLEGCLCLRIRPADGEDLWSAPAEHLASRFADLQLALAEAVHDLGLPAPIVGELLPLATRELLDGIRGVYTGGDGDAGGMGGDGVDLRWRRGRFDALVRRANGLSSGRVADYVATLVGRGGALR